MKVVLSDRLRRCTSPAIRLWMTQGWLRMSTGGLGLGQFEATFRESEIDFDVLPELTEPDLEKRRSTRPP
jgi:hypothetical protein